METSNEFGDGKYNVTVAAEVRWNRILDSMARNPSFNFLIPRYFTAYAESVFPYRFFVDGRDAILEENPQLDLTAARGFFQNSEYPVDFWRRNGSFGLSSTPGIGADIDAVSAPHFILPGVNEGAGNYVVDPTDPGFPGGVRILTQHLCEANLLIYSRSLVVVRNLHKAYQCHRTLSVPESHGSSSGGNAYEHRDVL